MVKAPGPTGRGPWKLQDLKAGEANGISGVAVKCVDTGRNTSGESDLLARP